MDPIIYSSQTHIILETSEVETSLSQTTDSHHTNAPRVKGNMVEIKLGSRSPLQDMQEILVDFNLGVMNADRQTNKFNSPSNFLAIR